MDAGVSVLCARVRLEEKRVLELLATGGIPARPLSPFPAPLPLGPLAGIPASGSVDRLIFDRCQDRIIARAVLPALEAAGATLLSAGLAARSDRLAVAVALTRAGVPRPATLLVASEETGLAALDEIGYPATLMPMTPGVTEVALCDRDIAEAVLEHRNVLGSSHDAVSLIQAGGCDASKRTRIFVVDHLAIGFESATGVRPGSALLALAERASRAVDADLAAVDIATFDPHGEAVVWDVLPVPDFRAATPLGAIDVASAVAALIARRIAADQLDRTASDAMPITGLLRQEVTDDVVLIA